MRMCFGFIGKSCKIKKLLTELDIFVGIMNLRCKELDSLEDFPY